MKKSFKKSILFMWLALLGFIMPMQVMADDYYLIGTFTNNWDLNSAIKLTRNGNQYEIKQSFNEKDEFKIVKNKDWNHSWGYSNVNDKSLVEKNDDNNAKILETGCYGLFFKPSDNTIYMTKSSDCPQPYSFWGFDILYQEGDTKKWASTKGSANHWDGKFIKTSGDNEEFDLGVIKRGTKFLGFRAYTNDNGSDVQGMNVNWSDVDSNAPAIEGGNYGKWSYDGTNGGSSGGTDEVWDVTDRSSRFMGYENGEYSFNLNFELKVNGNDKTLVRTIKIKYTIDEFELSADIKKAIHVGDIINLTVAGGTAPYAWEKSNDGITWTTISGVTSNTYSHTVLGGVYIRVKSSNKTSNVIELKPSILCDPANTDTIFIETFGTLSTAKARKSYNVVETKYSAYIPDGYAPHLNECSAMKSGGLYAVVANPWYAGCGETTDNITDETIDCNCTNKRRWFRDTKDHTSDDEVNGGMLFYNCKDGTKTDDVIYECVINDICPNTYINFSAWVTNANTGAYGNIPIEAEFRLYNAITGKDITSYKVTNIKLANEWREISAMFNSDDASKVKIQLVNKAGEGQGNDLLLDDIILSVCNPQAQLVFSGTTLSTATITQGEIKKLEASILSGLMTQSWYIWQSSTDNKTWTNISSAPENVDVNLPATLDVAPLEKTYYRAIVASSKEDADEILKGHNPSACGMYAITNVATIDVTISDLELTTSITDGNICVDGIDFTEITLTVKNPRLVAVTDVKVNLENIENLQISKNSGTYSNGVWTVENIDSKGSASIVLKVSSNTSVSTSTDRIIKSYISSVSAETPTTLKKIETTIKLIPLPAPPTLKNNGIYDECATTGNISLGTLFEGTGDATLKYYSDPELKSEITKGTFSASEIVKDKPYYATQTVNGCTSAAAVAKVTVKQLPTLTSVVTNKNAICGNETDSKATLTYNITGGKSPYGLTIQRIEGNSTSTISTEVKLVSGGTYDVQPSSDATYKFVKVIDSNGCYSNDASGLVDNIDINVENLFILEDLPVIRTVCADKTLEYTIKASGDNLNYQWYESIDNGVTFNRVGTNSSSYETEKFQITDKKKYKVKVYQSQSPEVCSAKESKESAVKVTDCSRLSLSYVLGSQSTSVCMGGEIKFIYTLTNSADATDINVKITNISNQTLQSDNASHGTYNHEQGVWTVGNLQKDEEATLEITIKGTTAVANKVTTAYVSKSGTTEYTEENTLAISSQTITVKNITNPPVLIAETYKACRESGMLDLETQISSDKTNLKFYTSETGTTYVKQASKSEEGTTPYWVSNKLDEECESPRTQLDIVVYPQPKASLSGTTTICKGKTADLTIKLESGTSPYNIELSDGTNFPASATTTTTVQPQEYTEYKLIKVTDANNCTATISGEANITVDDVPTINGIPENLTAVHVCDGDILTLPDLTVTANGSDILSKQWYFNGKLYTAGEKVSFSDGIKDVELKLEFSVKNGCGETRETVGLFIIESRPELESLDIEAENDIICAGTTTYLKAKFKGVAPYTFYVNDEKMTSPSSEWSMEISKAGDYKLTNLSDKYCTAESSEDKTVTLTVESIPVVSLSATDVTLNCTTPTATITASGGAYLYEWQDDKGSPVKTGDKLLVAQTDVAKPEFTTTYTVYGYSEKANCKSKYAITLTVKEDFVKPIVEITAPTDILTCTQTSIDLTVDATNNTENIVEYIWDGGAASSASTYQITSPGKHTLMVKGENGCSSDEAIKNITQNINKPEISIKSYNSSLEDASAGRTETKIITCTDSKLYLETTISKITDSGKIGYMWSNGSEEFSTEVSSAGTYTVTVTDKVNGCSQSASIVITKDENAANITEISSVTTLDEESEIYVETTELTCSITSLILNPIVTNVTSAIYEWSKFDKETGKYKKIGEDKTQTVTEEGVYKLVITDQNTGCPAEKEVTITQNIKKPEISIKSYNLPITDTSGKRVETQIVTCSDSKLYLETTISKITDSGKIGYMWSNGSEEFSTEVSSAGTYTVTVTDKANGCTQSTSIEITKDNNAATISKISSVTTLDESSEIYAETTELTCSITSLILNPTVTNVTSASYEWSKLNKETGKYNKIGSELTQTITEKGDYKFVVIDNSTGCPTEEEVTITENKRTPIIEDIISVNSTDKTAEGYLETQVINCRDKELFISSVIKDKVETQYSPEELKYDWTVSYDDGEIFEAYGEASTISTTSKAIFRLVVTDKVTGCPAVADTIIIKENIVKPVISYIESYETINPTGTGIKEEDVLTCKKPVIYLRPTIEESTDVSYKWSDDSTEDYLKVKEQGTYGLVVTDNTSFCSSDEVTFSVTENKRTPIIEDIISVNSSDETVEGYKETQIINCKDTELFISSVIKDKVETQYSPEELEYDWTVSYDNGEIFKEFGEAATITATEEAIFRLVVKDTLTGCPAEAKTIEITEVKTTPTIKSVTSVSTIDPEAEKVEETNVLTCEYPVLYLKPTIESDNEVSYKWNDESTLDYLKVEEEGTYTLIVKDETTFCSSEVYSYDVSENKNAPVLDIQSVYELCPSDTLSAKTLSSLLPKTLGITYKFYDESDVEIADLYKTSTENYYVVGVSENGCESNKTLFSVDLAKNVDFTLQASQTSMLVGGNETVITIVPDADSDVADTYTWYVNGDKLFVDGLEYSTNLYLDSKFEVTATNRCDSKSQDVFIEVLWPTAFTPHNDNGKNEDFAKGMPIVVFNRFYTKMFEGPDGWDGTINGTMNNSKQMAVPGVYFYSVKLPNGQVKKGTIEIVKVD